MEKKKDIFLSLEEPSIYAMLYFAGDSPNMISQEATTRGKGEESVFHSLPASPHATPPFSFPWLLPLLPCPSRVYITDGRIKQRGKIVVARTPKPSIFGSAAIRRVDGSADPYAISASMVLSFLYKVMGIYWRLKGLTLLWPECSG